MAEYSPEAMGAVIKVLRTKRKLTQEELGTRAGYQGGAGVSVSRLESGQMEPSEERFMEIARELGVTREELVALANARTDQLRRSSADGIVSVSSRIARIERVKEARKQLVADVDALNSASDRAKDDFLLRFHEIAGRLDGAPSPDPRDLATNQLPHEDDAEVEAALQIEFTRFGVEQALAGIASPAPGGATNADSAFEAFASLVSLGSFPLHSILPGLRIGAALKALQKTASMKPTLGAAGGIAVGVGIAAGAAIGWQKATAKRSSKQQHDLAEAEAAIAQTQPAVDALRDLVPKATETLDYIAVHASHALTRWEAAVGPESRDWGSLSANEQQRYYEFIEIAAAQLAVATMKLGDLLTTRDDELERAKALADEVLAQSRKVVTSHV